MRSAGLVRWVALIAVGIGVAVVLAWVGLQLFYVAVNLWGGR